MWTIFKVFIEFVTVLLLFYVSVFWPRGMWDPKLLSCVWLFAAPWTAAGQASLSFAISQSLIKLMSIESVMPCKHLALCPPWPAIKSTPPSLEGKVSSTGPPGKYQVRAFDNFIGFREWRGNRDSLERTDEQPLRGKDGRECCMEVATPTED